MRFVAILALLAGSAWSANSGDPSPSQIEDIIAKFAAKEAEFQKARGNYTYRQSAKIQELDDMGQAHGKWEMVSDIILLPRAGAPSEWFTHRSPVSNTFCCRPLTSRTFATYNRSC